MTVGEANAVNTLLSFMAQDRRKGNAVPSADEAALAARLLLRSANKTLMAGYTVEDVDRLFGAQMGGRHAG